jgi:diguanylate cyclase (GGDEF)-like protein
MFQRKLEEALKNNLPLAVMIIEIDHFKRYNNIYGPQAGDRVLKALSKFLKDSTRRIEDIVCRYGEDKFALLFTGASLSVVLRREEDLRERFKKIQVTFDNQTFEEVSFSIGIAAFPENGSTKETLLQEAETNLLLNKDMKQREDPHHSNYRPN